MLLHVQNLCFDWSGCFNKGRFGSIMVSFLLYATMRTIVISPHVFEKHMDASNVSVSVLFNEFIMFKSVKVA